MGFLLVYRCEWNYQQRAQIDEISRLPSMGFCKTTPFNRWRASRVRLTRRPEVRLTSCKYIGSWLTRGLVLLFFLEEPCQPCVVFPAVVKEKVTVSRWLTKSAYRFVLEPSVYVWFLTRWSEPVMPQLTWSTWSTDTDRWCCICILHSRNFREIHP